MQTTTRGKTTTSQKKKRPSGAIIWSMLQPQRQSFRRLGSRCRSSPPLPAVSSFSARTSLWRLATSSAHTRARARARPRSLRCSKSVRHKRTSKSGARLLALSPAGCQWRRLCVAAGRRAGGWLIAFLPVCALCVLLPPRRPSASCCRMRSERREREASGERRERAARKKDAASSKRTSERARAHVCAHARALNSKRPQASERALQPSNCTR